MTDQDRLVLDLFHRYPRDNGRRTRAIRDELGWTSTRWAQELVRLVARPDVMLEYPVLCGRVRRVLAAGNRLKRAG